MRVWHCSHGQIYATRSIAPRSCCFQFWGKVPDQTMSPWLHLCPMHQSSRNSWKKLVPVWMWRASSFWYAFVVGRHSHASNAVGKDRARSGSREGEWDFRTTVGKVRSSYGNGEWSCPDGEILDFLQRSRAVKVNGRFGILGDTPQTFVQLLCNGSSEVRSSKQYSSHRPDHFRFSASWVWNRQERVPTIELQQCRNQIQGGDSSHGIYRDILKKCGLKVGWSTLYFPRW